MGQELPVKGATRLEESTAPGPSEETLQRLAQVFTVNTTDTLEIGGTLRQVEERVQRLEKEMEELWS